MKENKRLFVVLGIFVILCIAIIIASVKGGSSTSGTSVSESDVKEGINYITYGEYEEKLNSDKNEFVVLVQTGCGYCEMSYEEFAKIYKETGYVTSALNITELSDDERTNLINSLDYLGEGEWGTPLLMILNNGKLVDKHNGYAESTEYLEFLKSNNIIGE